MSSFTKTLLLIFSLGLGIYFISLTNGFVFDDIGQIQNNYLVHSLSNIPTFFRGGNFYSGQPNQLLGNFYRPLPSIYFTIVYSIFGPNPSAFHLLQLLLHIANTILLLILFRKFLNHQIAFILAIIFLVHPVNTEAVVYISDFQDLLFFFFGLGALMVSLINNKNKISYLIVALLTLLALLSKETGLIFIPILILGQYLFRNARELKTSLLATLGGLASYLLLRVTLAGFSLPTRPVTPIMSANLQERFLSIPKIISTYLSIIFFPKDLAFGQQWVVKNTTLSDFYLPLLLVIIFTIASTAIFFDTRQSAKYFKPYSFFLFWFLIGLAFHLQIFPLDQTVADRWLYFPLVGFLAMIGIVCQNLPKKAIAIGFIIIVTIFSARSFVRSLDWKDSLTLLTHDIQINPDSFTLQSTLGIELVNIGKYDQARQHLEKSIHLYPAFVNWHNLGVLNSRTGDFDASQKAYQEALRYGDFYLTYENMVGNLLFQNKFNDALSLAQLALTKYSQDYRLWLYWSIAQYNLGNKELAVRGASYAYKIFPAADIPSVLDNMVNNRDIKLDN